MYSPHCGDTAMELHQAAFASLGTYERSLRTRQHPPMPIQSDEHCGRDETSALSVHSATLTQKTQNLIRAVVEPTSSTAAVGGAHIRGVASDAALPGDCSDLVPQPCLLVLPSLSRVPLGPSSCLVGEKKVRWPTGSRRQSTRAHRRSIHQGDDQVRCLWRCGYRCDRVLPARLCSSNRLRRERDNGDDDPADHRRFGVCSVHGDPALCSSEHENSLAGLALAVGGNRSHLGSKRRPWVEERFGRLHRRGMASRSSGGLLRDADVVGSIGRSTESWY